jgi:hypothetical protein
MRSIQLKVGDKLKPFRLSDNTEHTGTVIKVYGTCCDVELDNGHIMKNIAMHYLTKTKNGPKS